MIGMIVCQLSEYLCSNLIMTGIANYKST